MISDNKFLLNETVNNNWKRKRRNTYIIYNLLYFNTGFKLTLTVATSWMYVTTLLHTDQKQLYYALINLVAFTPSILCTSFIAKHFDKTRNIKFCLLVIYIIATLGGVMYTLPLAPILPVIGSFLSGFLLTLRPLMVAEIARSYPQNEAGVKLSFFTCSHGIGMAMGPVIAILFKNINFSIMGLPFTYGNIPGVLKTIQCLISVILIIIFVEDLSKEFDLKAETQIVDKDKKEEHFIFEIFYNFDITYLIATAFIASCFDDLLFVWFPVFIVETLNYSYDIVGLCYTIPCSLYIIMMFILLKFGGKIDFDKVGIACWVLAFSMGIILFVMNPQEVYKLEVALLLLLTCFLQMYAFGMLIFVTVSLTSFAQSKNQSFLDSFRCQSRQLGGLVGALIGSYSASHKNCIAYVLCSVSVIMLTTMIFRKKYLGRPNIHT